MKRFLLTLLGAVIGVIVAALLTLVASFPIMTFYDGVGDSHDGSMAGAFLIFYLIWPVLTLVSVIAGAVLGYRLSNK